MTNSSILLGRYVHANPGEYQNPHKGTPTTVLCHRLIPQNPASEGSCKVGKYKGNSPQSRRSSDMCPFNLCGQFHSLALSSQGTIYGHVTGTNATAACSWPQGTNHVDKPQTCCECQCNSSCGTPRRTNLLEIFTPEARSLSHTRCIHYRHVV